MFERYTESARRVIFFARFETLFHRAGAISTAHLLLGLNREEKSHAGIAVLIKDHIVELCAQLGIPYPSDGKVPYDLSVDVPLDKNSKLALAYAAKEANKDWQYWIDTDHLLRGILRFPNETSKALESISLDLATARAASKRHRAEFPPERTPFLTLTRILFEPLKMAFLKLAILALVLLVGGLVLHWVNH